LASVVTLPLTSTVQPTGTSLIAIADLNTAISAIEKPNH